MLHIVAYLTDSYVSYILVLILSAQIWRYSTVELKSKRLDELKTGDVFIIPNIEYQDETIVYQHNGFGGDSSMCGVAEKYSILKRVPLDGLCCVAPNAKDFKETLKDPSTMVHVLYFSIPPHRR